MIEGVFYYEKENADVQIEQIKEEKNILISMMIEASKKGEETVKPEIIEKRILTCETLD